MEIGCLTINSHPIISQLRRDYTGDSDPFRAEGENKARLAGGRQEAAERNRSIARRPPYPAQQPFSSAPEDGPLPTQRLTGMWARYQVGNKWGVRTQRNATQACPQGTRICLGQVRLFHNQSPLNSPQKIPLVIYFASLSHNIPLN